MLNPYYTSNHGTLYHGDALETLRQLPDESVQCCVTSPPYYSLRDYGVAGQIGLEPTHQEYIDRLVTVFDEVKRVLAVDGTLWLNAGDTYSAQRKNQTADNKHKNIGQRPPVVVDMPIKNLLGIPWRLAFALQARGWYLRCDIIWHKSNAMPESVKDRPARAHEYLFLFAKSEKYYYDHEAVKEPAVSSNLRDFSGGFTGYQPPGQPPHSGGRYGKSGNKQRKPGSARGCPEGTGSNVYGSVPWQGFTRNQRSVWTIPIHPYAGAHFATFPPALITPCILAGSRPGNVILDPFMGSGTTGQVARKLGRQWLGIELNQEYCDMALERIGVHENYLWEIEQPVAQGHEARENA